MIPTVHHGDCLAVLPTLEASSFDACVTDPPYHLTSIVKRFGSATAAPATFGSDGAYARASRGFMGKAWDGGDISFQPALWAEVLRVLKPGAWLLAFGGTRTFHRMVCAIEDAGFDVRDDILWLYGTGFPKSHDVAKAIDKKVGAVRTKVRYAPRSQSAGSLGGTSDPRPWVDKALLQGFHEAASHEASSHEAAQWTGFGTALKPAMELICVARKPLIGTLAENVLQHGCGGLNIDACRVPIDPATDASQLRTLNRDRRQDGSSAQTWGFNKQARDTPQVARMDGRWPTNVIHDGSDEVLACFPEGKARFFYTAKADKADRAGSKHPTVKPLDLMNYLCRLVTPPSGVVLDPFAGSGTTGEAAMLEGFGAVLIEREAEYVADIKRRLNRHGGADLPLMGATDVPA